MLHRWAAWWTVVAVSLQAGGVRGQEAFPPREVKVLPVFFVPKGGPEPTEDQIKRLLKHLTWSQDRYRELLRNQGTFAAEGKKPRVHRFGRPLESFRGQPDELASEIVGELLGDLKFTRYNCPYVLLTVVMNPKDDFPTGGGRPLNGGYNTGGGLIVLSSFALDRVPNFQSTLQHELGHAFGLPHVDVYGYDMKKSESLMSYNPGHHTKGFTPSRTPGRLLPEDLRGLALNQRAFPKLRFDPRADVPAGYKLAPAAVPLGPMKISGQPDGVKVTTPSGEDFGSKVSNVVQVHGRIEPSVKTGRVTFDPRRMWQSAKSATGWVSVEVTFPYDVALTRIGIHSQHSGEYNPARAVRVSVQDAKGKPLPVANARLKSADEKVSLPPMGGQAAQGRVWLFEFQAGPSGSVTLRGLQFFSGDTELFPPLVPTPE
jgi:hypothetical protein